MFSSSSSSSNRNNLPKKRSKSSKKLSSRMSKNKKAIQRAQEILDREFNNKGPNQALLLRSVKAIIKARNNSILFTIQQKPSRDFTYFLRPLRLGSRFRLTTKPKLRDPSRTFNINRSTQYLLAITINIAKGAEVANKLYTRYINRLGLFR